MINSNLFTNDEYSKIETMINSFNKGKNYEFEISFKGITYDKFIKTAEKLSNISSDKDRSNQKTLDISIILFGNINYRVSIMDDEKIDKFIQLYKKKDVSEIQEYLLSLKPSDDYEIITKERDPNNMIKIEDLDVMIKLAKENLYDSKLTQKMTGTEKMLYRYKNRYSFTIDNFRYDLTEVQQTTNLMRLMNTYTSYEIELEAVKKFSIDDLITALNSTLAIIQNSPVAIGKTEAQSVNEIYSSLFNLQKNSQLEVRNVVSIETQHLNFIPNRYAVTEKADGDRVCLIILENGVYLISTNRIVTKTDLVIKDSRYYKTVLDGELVRDGDKYLFMAFDVIYSNGVDYSNNNKFELTHRIDILNNIIDKCFGNLIPFTFYVENNSDMEITKIKQYYASEIKKYWKNFNSLYKKSKTTTFVTKKLYFVPYGIDKSEIFMYADTLWKNMYYNNITPYTLDGIIYTPINSPYMIKANIDMIDTVPMEYKWKPPNKNSIDFYIEFEKNSNGQDTIFYDDAVVKIESPAYKICKLMVGINKGTMEKPIPFKVNGSDQKANIYLSEDGEAVDSEGNVVNDKTVVEFIFDTKKPDLPNSFNWIALRTRHDKTESVRNFRKKYGNNLNIAKRIWRTIINPISEESIAILGNPETFQTEITRLSNSRGSFNEKGVIYYQKISGNAKSMRAFNNWLKFTIINNYCQNKPSVLDIGCGRGGDILKFINSNISEYVGIDIDNNGLYTISGSAYNRYKNYKMKLKNVPPMYFIHADARAKFNVKDQEAVVPNMKNSNKDMIEKYLNGSKKYNVINAQFTIHYYLADAVSWSNFCKNINDHLEDGGYLLVTGFDGNLIYDNMANKQKMTVSYTDDKGKKVKFFEILKRYANDTEKKLGVAIELYNSLYSNPDTYIREYLVFPQFLIKSLKEKCGLSLVETDSFYNMFNLYKDYFEDSLGESNKDSRYQKVREFYMSMKPNNNTDVSIDIATASFKLSMLNRFYVFKKVAKYENVESRIVGINKRINLGNMLHPYFVTNNMILIPNTDELNINTIYKNIRKRYSGIKPSVYIVRHTVPVEKFSNQILTRNKFEFIKAKSGDETCNKILLIYKSPDKIFHPIYFRENDDVNFNLDDDLNYFQDENVRNVKGTFMLDGHKILNDLELLVSLTNKINS